MTYGRLDVYCFHLNPLLSLNYRLLGPILVFACLAVSSFAQEPQQQKPDDLAQAESSLWDRRVKDLIRLTDDSVSKLSDHQNAFYLVLVTKISWSYDQPAGRQRLRRAADIVFRRLTDNTAEGGTDDIKFATKAINMMFEIDRDYAAELVRRAERHFDDEATGSRLNDEDLAEHFAAIGTTVADFNPQLGYYYGTRSLRYGLSGSLPLLTARINKNDRVLADKLVARAVTAAKGVYHEKSYLLAFNLNRQMSAAK